jgi:DNA mismatch repair ATPase MutS
LEDNIEVLVNAGFKVAICEQTENCAQMEIRLKKEAGSEGADNIQAVKREV